MMAGSTEPVIRFAQEPNRTEPTHKNNNAGNERSKHRYPRKLPDLISRINGGIITIPDFEDEDRSDIAKANKICITLSLLRKRFGKSFYRVPLSIIKFICSLETKYRSRSIGHIIDLLPIDLPNICGSPIEQNLLPFDSADDVKECGLVYHVNNFDLDGIYECWIECQASTSFLSCHYDPKAKSNPKPF